MSDLINDLSNACIVVMAAWVSLRYARGWRLQWVPPKRDEVAG